MVVSGDISCKRTRASVIPKAEPRVGAVLVSPADEQVATAHRHVQATRGLARFEQRLQRGDDRWQP